MSEIDRREIRKAHSFTVCVCSDPNCGPHIIANDADGEPVIEIVMSREQGVEHVKKMQSLLYRKAVER